jgi:hypothetical protein
MTFGAGERILSDWMSEKCVRDLARAPSTVGD